MTEPERNPSPLPGSAGPPRLSGLAAILSLLLFVLILITWVRSYCSSGSVSYGYGSEGPSRHILDAGHQVTRPGDRIEHLWALRRARGQLALWVERNVNPSIWSGQIPPGWEMTSFAGSGPLFTSIPPEATAIQIGGFAFVSHVYDENYDVVRHYSTHVIAVPFWFAALLAGTSAAIWYRRHRRQSLRHLLGLCPACGYDLRSTPDRCPECGQSPPRAAAPGLCPPP